MEPQTKVCPVCSTEIPATAKTCSQCQASFEITISGYCTTCHELTTADEMGKCLRCGNPVLDARVESKMTGLPTRAPAVSKPVLGPTDQDYSRPGSYIDNQLEIGEKILFRTRLHGMLLVSAIFSLIVGVGLYFFFRSAADTLYSEEFARIFNRSISPGDTIMDVIPNGVYMGYLIAALFILVGLRKVVTLLSSEIAITNQRVLGRIAAFIPRRVDIPLASIASVIYGRGFLGNYGSIFLSYLPRRRYTIPYIPRPAGFYQRLHALMPAHRPSLEKVGLGRVLLIVFGVLLVIAGTVFGVYYFSGGREELQPVAMVDFDTIIQYPKNRRVSIEGYLELPTSFKCDTDCNIYLVDYDNPEKKLVIFVDLPSTNATPAPGEMKKLPVRYNASDLAVRLADGGYAGHGEDVRLTGQVWDTTAGEACLLVTNAEKGSLPDTPTPTPSMTPTPGPTFTPTRTPTPSRTATLTRTATPIPTDTLPPTQTPLPVNATYDNICDYKDRLVIVQGKLSLNTFMTFCSFGHCPLYLKEVGGQWRELRITIGYGGGVNEMDPLPDKYRSTDLKVHTADGQTVGVNSLVEILGKVSDYPNATGVMVKCSLHVLTVNVP